MRLSTKMRVSLTTFRHFSHPKHILNGSGKSKKRKHFEMKKNVIEESIRLPNLMIGYSVPSMQPPDGVSHSLPQEAKGPCYSTMRMSPLHERAFGTPSRVSCTTSSQNLLTQSSSQLVQERGATSTIFPSRTGFPSYLSHPLPSDRLFPYREGGILRRIKCIPTVMVSAKLTERICIEVERNRVTHLRPSNIMSWSSARSGTWCG